MAVFDLNARRKEAKAKKEPFELKVGTSKFTFIHPQDADWKDVAEGQRAALQGDPEPMIKALLSEDYARFAEVKISVEELELILTEVQKHYGVTPGE